MSRIAVITGSTRPRRISPQVAAWVIATGNAIFSPESTALELVDLKEWALPLLDEPGIPAYGNYAHEHTRAWSRAISGYDGFVFVTPQYNWGYPAPLKNALDYLYAEWQRKPAVIVSYGAHGGGKAAAQLRQVLEGLKMRPATAMPALTLTREMYGDDGFLADAPECLAPYTEEVRAALAEMAALLKAE